jgi:GxxExxY protein
MRFTVEHKELTSRIIGCAFLVYNKMGFGFWESVYEKCMLIELHRLGLKAEAQKPITVHYDGEIVGEYVADLLVNDVVLIEPKSVRKVALAHEVQLVNYLTATGMPVGLLLNFSENGVEISRKIRTLQRGKGQVQDDPVDPVDPVKWQCKRAKTWTRAENMS